MYSVYDYGRLIADSVRTHAYAQALRRVVKPDSVVLDIGTGTGIFALLATFLNTPLAPADLLKLADSHVPTLNEDGQIDRLLLELMHHGTPLGDIASRLSAEFPARFATWEDALTRVGKLSQKYSR
ncbi:MAG: hypothetical protein HY725_05080 [Candidatus Rokubacteria bacterium]|nr:hypothetical protein [Candidatus Rokubacteria bacterium]